MSLNSDDETIEQLLVLAGPRDEVPAERLERMRAAVHDAWTRTPLTRARSASGERPEDKPRGWGPAELKEEKTPKRLFGWTLVTAAAAAAIVIAIVRTPPDTSIARRAEAPASAAMQIATGPAERKSVPLPAGGELRVDASSVVIISEGGEIHLNKGALYLDSKGTTLPPVITPAGKITDIGTRFEVRVIGDSTRVRVRDGKVRLAQSSGSSEVDAAEELLARADASTARRRIDPFGAEWAWVTRAAPRFDVEGKSLESFLDWIETEGAWTVEFSSPALERRARSTVLHGSIEDMSTTEALEAILLACGLGHRVDLKAGRVTVIADR